MKSLIIHIGAHKTGTTMVQSCFDRNSKTLKSLGVIYPRSNWYHHSQHRLAFAMKGMKDPTTGADCNYKSEIDELNEQIESAPDNSKIFISSEEFFSAPIEKIYELRDNISCDAVSVVAFVRSPDDLFLSFYNQNTKEPRNSFSKTISSIIDDPFNINQDMHMGRCVLNWASAFGNDGVSLHCYEDASPLEVILNILKLPGDAITAPERVNESVPAAVVEIMRLSKFFTMPLKTRIDLYAAANKIFAGSPKAILEKEDRQKILTATQQELDDLFSSFGRKNPYRQRLISFSGESSPPIRQVEILVKLVEALLQERGRK